MVTSWINRVEQVAVKTLLSLDVGLDGILGKLGLVRRKNAINAEAQVSRTYDDRCPFLQS